MPDLENYTNMTDLTSQIIDQRIEENRKLIEKLERDIHDLEKQRVNHIKVLEQNNFEDGTQDQLRLIDREIEHNKERTRIIETQINDIRHKFQLIHQNTQDSYNDTIQSRIIMVSAERDRVRNELLPMVTILMQDLESRKRALDSIILSLSKEINIISRNKRDEDLDSDIQ